MERRQKREKWEKKRAKCCFLLGLQKYPSHFLEWGVVFVKIKMGLIITCPLTNPNIYSN